MKENRTEMLHRAKNLGAVVAALKAKTKVPTVNLTDFLPYLDIA